MSAIIKGMEIPVNCFNCSFCTTISDCLRIWVVCKAKDLAIDDQDAVKAGRPDWCPLEEVKT